MSTAAQKLTWRINTAKYYRENKELALARARRYRNSPNGRLVRKGLFLKRRYDISLEAFNLLKCLQRHKCAICGTPSNGNRDFHVDHDHDTGKVRGLLCNKCNVGLGMLESNINETQEYLANPILS